MIGLEFLCELYDIQHNELAEILGIKKQNINFWIKGKRKIPSKYLPILVEKFDVEEAYLIKELDAVDKLKLEKDKMAKQMNDEPFMEHSKVLLMEWMEYHIDEENTIANLTKVIRQSDKDTEGEVLDDVRNRLDICKLFINLMERKEVSKGILRKMLKAFVEVEKEDTEKDKFNMGISDLIKKYEEEKNEKHEMRKLIEENAEDIFS